MNFACIVCQTLQSFPVAGRKGVDAGLLNCLQMHFRSHEVVRCEIVFFFELLAHI